VNFSQCYYLQNQPRRCLAALEQRGLLSAHNTQLLSTSLLTSNSDSLLSTETTPLSRSDFIDLVSAFQLAARCLFSLQEYEDCVTLLGPLVSLDIDLDSEDCHLVGCRTAVSRAKALFQPVDESECNTSEKHAPSSSSGPTAAASMEINPMSGIYNMIGQCYDQLDNRPRAIKALVAALTVDSACTEAAEYLVSHGLLSPSEKKSLLTVSLDLTHGRAWLESYYRFILLGEPPGSAAATEKKSTLMEGPSAGVCQVSWEPSSAEWMARNAEILYDRMLPEESYRLARQAYNLDPFGPRGLLVYIACLLQLKMKTELFYLGHELSSAYPKIAMSWYAVGCYYLCCNKPEAAQKHLQRATKIDKRFAKAWVALGQSLSAQEESEHAIAAYRAACRLLPGDHRPMVLMAKELVSGVMWCGVMWCGVMWCSVM
jgi:tetratricopeptide (TPR) repeat protein